jgi:hypothetical protein
MPQHATKYLRDELKALEAHLAEQAIDITPETENSSSVEAIPKLLSRSGG